MKKRLFLFLALIVAICALFAISASARTYTEGNDVYVVTLEGNTIKVTTYDDFLGKTNLTYRADDIVVFDDDFACPSIYIFEDSATLEKGEYSSSGLKKALDFSFLKDHGKNYTYDDIVEIDIPQGVTTINAYLLNDLTGIKKVSIPSSVTTLGNAVFQNATGLLECVFEHSEDSDLTALGQYFFDGCTNLRAFSMPDCITEMGGKGYQFQNCTNLTAMYLSKNLVTISVTNASPFSSCSSLYFVDTPFTTSDTAPAKPDVYYFHPDLTMPGARSMFSNCSSLNNVLVFGENLTSISSQYFFQNAPSGMTAVFLGDMTAINTSKWGNVKIMFANSADMSVSDVTFTPSTPNKTISFCASETDLSKHLASPNNSKIEAATCYSNQKGVVRCFCNIKISEGEVADTMLNTHDYVDDFDCTTANYCKNFGEGKCDKFLVAEFDAHDEKHDVIFANGFTSAGVHNTYCSNANCKALDEVENLSAMFVHEGYSYKNRTYGGIDAKFQINTKAVKLYEQYEGEIHFGIMIANAAHFANVDAFIKDGKLTSTNAKGENSGIMVEMTSREYEYFNCYIDGFKLDDPDHVALGLIIAGYVYGKDPTDITYIQKDYKTDNDQTTLEIPYVATITKDKEVKIVNIVAVKEFEPIKETQQ